MDWNILFKAIGLVLIFEGIMPFVMPEKWKKFLLQMASQPDSSLRTIGLVSMILGLTLISLL